MEGDVAARGVRSIVETFDSRVYKVGTLVVGAVVVVVVAAVVVVGFVVVVVAGAAAIDNDEDDVVVAVVFIPGTADGVVVSVAFASNSVEVDVEVDAGVEMFIKEILDSKVDEVGALAVVDGCSKQCVPFPVYPILHEHIKLPSVFLHEA